MVLSNKLYEQAKWLIQILLPALATLYFTIGQIWGLPVITEVLGTIAAVATFLGVILRISTVSYYQGDRPYDGTIVVDDSEDALKYNLHLNDDPAKLKEQDKVAFKVEQTPSAK